MGLSRFVGCVNFGADEGDYDVDAEVLRLMSQTADDVERSLGPTRGPVTLHDEKMALLLQNYDGDSQSHGEYVQFGAWADVMGWVVRAAMTATVDKFSRVRPDNLCQKVHGVDRERTRAQFRWGLVPEFPWSETIIYKDYRTVCFACPYCSFADEFSSGLSPFPVLMRANAQQ